MFLSAWKQVISLFLLLCCQISLSTNEKLFVDPVGSGYDVVWQVVKEAFVDFEYTQGNTFHGYLYPDALYCENAFFSYYSSDYVQMQVNAYNYSVTSESDFSLDLAVHFGNEALGFGYQSTYQEAQELLGYGLSYFAVSNKVFGNYYCRLQPSYEVTIPALANKLAPLPNQCTATADFNQYLELVETTGTHFITGVNFGGMVNFTVSVEKSAMESMSYSQQQQLLNAGLYSLQSNQSIGLTYSQNQTASEWTKAYAEVSFNSTIYRGGVYDGNYNDWAASLTNLTNNVWLPFCNSLIPLDSMVPLYVPQSKRQCYSNAIWSYWSSYGSPSGSKRSVCRS